METRATCAGGTFPRNTWVCWCSILVSLQMWVFSSWPFVTRSSRTFHVGRSIDRVSRQDRGWPPLFRAHALGTPESARRKEEPCYPSFHMFSFQFQSNSYLLWRERACSLRFVVIYLFYTRHVLLEEALVLLVESQTNVFHC